MYLVGKRLFQKLSVSALNKSIKRNNDYHILRKPQHIEKYCILMQFCRFELSFKLINQWLISFLYHIDAVFLCLFIYKFSIRCSIDRRNCIAPMVHLDYYWLPQAVVHSYHASNGWFVFFIFGNQKVKLEMPHVALESFYI